MKRNTRFRSFVLVLGALAVADSVMAQGVTYTVLHSFTGWTNDGAFPQSGVMSGAGGNLYGTTFRGGGKTCASLGCGIVYEVDAAGNFTIAYRFSNHADGAYPSASLIGDGAGDLYGTNGGGPFRWGVLFKLDAAGQVTVLHTFTGGADGGNPIATPVLDGAGNLYGTTLIGGSGCAACGTVYQVDPSGNFSVIHAFTGAADGANPGASILLDSSGSLFGTAQTQGPGGHGVIFKIDGAGNYTVLHAFSGGADGGLPFAGVIQDAAGNLYGTAAEGGARGFGVVYKADPTGNLTVLHNFQGGKDGRYPYGGLVADSAGNFYGTTWEGGVQKGGVVYKLNSSGKISILHAFNPSVDGAQANTMILSGGYLYGTTRDGGSSHKGVVFSVKLP